ncbi:MAG: PilZ domain-containing protein [Deltaproteobacteria bacterium]|nr:MAG: PilZ domain-containing protein [Deltaproteobacteria bacterium]
MPVPQEKRSYPRTEVRWPVAMEIAQESLTGAIEDVSLGGAFIRCRNPLKLNDVFAMVINVPDVDSPIEIIAEVIWSNIHGSDDRIKPRGMGVKFKDI